MPSFSALFTCSGMQGRLREKYPARLLYTPARSVSTPFRKTTVRIQYPAHRSGVGFSDYSD